MTLVQLLAWSGAIVGVLYLILWVRSLVEKRVTVIDPFWGLGFPILGFALVRLVGPEQAGPRTWLVLAMLTAWGLRYACHIWFRSWGHDEASLYYPYAEQRQKWGPRFWWVSLFAIFVPQMIGHLVIGLPMLLVIHDPGPALAWLDWVGFGVWLTGASCEAIADLQMMRFKGRPENAGKVLDRGLWRYSRHPNYFGDALGFWGIAIVAASSPLGAWGFVGPLLLTLMLRFFSGVTMVEARSKVGQRPEYAAYVKRTSTFVPWFPKPG